jgi:hypothetical protein
LLNGTAVGFFESITNDSEKLPLGRLRTKQREQRREGTENTRRSGKNYSPTFLDATWTT